MAGGTPLIQVQNTLHSLQFAPYSLVHHHHHHLQLMHQHYHHQRAFPPLLLQPSSVPPAAPDSGLQSNMQRLKPSLAAVTAFHRATHRSFSTKHGRCGALHVCIAWKIYYHKQLKKMQQNPNSPHREATPESPSAVVVSPDSVQHERPERPSSKRANPGSSCGRSAAYRNTADRRETSLSTSGTRREKLELLQPQWRERLDDEEHRGGRTDATEGVPLGDEPWDPKATRELGGSRDRKRQRECGGFVKVKRAKREMVDDEEEDEDQFPSIKIRRADPSAFSATRSHPSPRTIPVQHLSDLSVLYPNSGQFNVARAPAGLFPYPGADVHPYRTASWEPTWDRNHREDLHCRHDDYAGTRTPLLVAQMQKAAFFRDLSAQSLFFPRASGSQETGDVRGWDAPVVCPSTLLS